jgi:hypothetical protein
MLLADGLKSADESSSTAEGKTMETTELDRMGRRKTLDAFERGITGGHHIGHLPLYVQEIEGWIFRRCRCGFTLALTPNGAILWLKITKPAIEINNFTSLLRALNSDCWRIRGPSHRSMPLLLQAQLRKLRQKQTILALQKTQSVVERDKPQCEIPRQSKANRKDSDPILRVEQTPPIKRRKTYIPNNATQRTRPR